MKRGGFLIILIVMLIPCTTLAEGHRVGVGLGSTSGTHEQNDEIIDLKGELLEIPVYSYVANNGLLVGFRLMEFSVRGEKISGLNRLDLSYKQSLLAASLGFEFKIGDNWVITPQIVKSYLGSSRFHYANYTTDTGWTDYPYEYVSDTNTISGTAELSGWEVPVYWAGKYFLFGLKLCSYNSKSEIDWPDGSISEVTITGALAMVLEAQF
ncbi:MAG: hypothetical protein HN580_01800 [Deltaproteobacteria bacterium]|jgi:hypothetical protein|nr:hypothetical protein [Deltaproteobacteria bacterium]MBT4637797.1 hypothetical protein [Deltaproteobacteria bacterium]MBT6498747.1 hypothetical protein [Deltaproteobacteria bacterium]MBT6616357.1 hypothetical protein [Deltaproteobacteria bacterium]MBT7156180.1 hypothetical protein [Deltaproteobacteria bacterium]